MAKLNTLKEDSLKFVFYSVDILYSCAQFIVLAIAVKSVTICVSYQSLVILKDYVYLIC